MKVLIGLTMTLVVFGSWSLRAQGHSTSNLYCVADVPGTLLGGAYAPKGATSYSWVVHGGVITNGQGTDCIYFTGSGGWSTVVVTITDSSGTRTDSCKIELHDTGGGPGGAGKRALSSSYMTVGEVLTLLADVKDEPFKVALDGIDLLLGMTSEDLSNRKVAYLTDENNVITLTLEGGTRERDIKNEEIER